MISVGLDVGGTKILGVAIDQEGSLLAEHRRETVNDGEQLLDELGKLYEEIAADFGGDWAAGGASPPVGVGVPGLVDSKGVLLFAPNLLGANRTDVAAGLEARLSEHSPSVQVDNDATCAAAGESAFGAGAGRSDVLFVTLGTGIGGGVVAGGRLLRGAGNLAGEIGHFVVDPQGPPCGCGRRGCWERYASGSGLGRIARDAALAGRASRVMALAGGDADSVLGEHVVVALSEG
ncbi:MAG: ROK family protein, partial [Acidimicrobiales bacterium]